MGTHTLTLKDRLERRERADTAREVGRAELQARGQRELAARNKLDTIKELAIAPDIQRECAANNTANDVMRAKIGARAADVFADRVRSGEYTPEDVLSLVAELSGITPGGYMASEASDAFIVQLARELIEAA